MLPALFGALGLGAAAVAASKNDADNYGTVSLGMGGRGPRAGAGVASHLGGRTTNPYEYDVPSSVVSNWASGDVYGFMIPLFNIPVGAQSRVEHLTDKIDRAKEKIAELEKQLPQVGSDPSQLDRLATRIATFEAKIDKWQEKRDKVEMRMGAMYGAEVSQPPGQQLQTIELLANRVVDSARKLRNRPNSRKAQSWRLDMVTSYDAMSGAISGLRAHVSGSAAPVTTQQQAPHMAPYVPPAMPDFSVFGKLFGKKEGPEPHPVDPKVQASLQRAHEAAAEYRRVRDEAPGKVKPLEEAVIEWRVELGKKFAEKMRDQNPAVYGVLTKDAPEDEDEFGSDEFGLFGLGKKNREKRLQRRHARVADKLEATEEGTKKHERLQRRLERIEAKMDKHDIEYGLYDDYAYGGDWDEDDGQVDLEEVYDQFGFLPLLFSPLTYVAAGAVRAAGAKDRRASRKTGKRALWGRYHREIQRAMKAGNHSKASRIRGKQESLEKKMGASEVEKAREEAERYSFGARFSPRQPVRRMEVVNEDEFFGLEDVPLFG